MFFVINTFSDVFSSFAAMQREIFTFETWINGTLSRERNVQKQI